MTALELLCRRCAASGPFAGHPCRHGRELLHLVGASTAVRAAFAFGDWPPASELLALVDRDDPLWARYGDR